MNYINSFNYMNSLNYINSFRSALPLGLSKNYINSFNYINYINYINSFISFNYMNSLRSALPLGLSKNYINSFNSLVNSARIVPITEGSAYTLQGTPATASTRGIVIEGSQKVVRK